MNKHKKNNIILKFIIFRTLTITKNNKNIEKMKETNALVVIEPKTYALIVYEKGPDKGKTKEKSFRIRAKYWALTYPNLPDVDNLEEIFWKSLKKAFNIEDDTCWKYIIAKEKHKNGIPHIHVYLEFSRFQEIYSRKKLHVIVYDKICEGNYAAARKKRNWIQYIVKSVENMDDLYTNMEINMVNGLYYNNYAEHLHAVVKDLGIDEALDTLFEKYPKQTITKGTTIIKNLYTYATYLNAKNIDEDRAPLKELTDFIDIPNEIIKWIETKSTKRKTLIIWGPSGTGKTQLALAIANKLNKKPYIIREKNFLKNVVFNKHTLLIFDDLNVKSLSREESIHIFDSEEISQVRILYGFVIIPAGTNKIFTSNCIKDYNLKDKAINRRVISVNIEKSLFNLTKTTETTTETNITLKIKTKSKSVETIIAEPIIK